MRLQLAPLTAVRWVIPTVFMAASNSASRELVSPVTMPGRSPRASPSKRPAAAVKCCRSSAGPVCEGPATESISGAELADRTAASAWPGSGAASLPVVRSRCPGAAWSQPAPPITSRVACARTRCPSTCISIRFAGTAQRSASPERPTVLSRRGAPVISTSAATSACAATYPATAPSCRREVSTAAWPPAAAPRIRATARVAGKLRRARPVNRRDAPSGTCRPCRPALRGLCRRARRRAAPGAATVPRRPPPGPGRAPPAARDAGSAPPRPQPTPAMPRGPGAHPFCGAFPLGPGWPAAGSANDASR